MSSVESEVNSELIKLSNAVMVCHIYNGVT